MGRIYLFITFFFSSVLFAEELPSLDEYLRLHEFVLHPSYHKNEGFATKMQLRQFNALLATYPPIHTILEIGLNAGHSAENFFQECPYLTRFVSFDINMYRYTNIAVGYLLQKYQDRFCFVEGDSRLTLSAYNKAHPEETFDLIYIDGNHAYEYVLADIRNCKAFAHPGTILWLDDYRMFEASFAIDACVREGLIEMIQIHTSKDPTYGRRCFVEARYR